MTRTIRKLFIALTCTALFLTVFQVCGALAATAQSSRSAAARGEDEQSEVQWSYGKITLSPHKVGKTLTMVSIDQVQYVMSSKAEIIEQVEEKPGTVINKPSNSSAMGFGKRVSFAYTGEGQPVIFKVVVDSVPSRK